MADQTPLVIQASGMGHVCYIKYEASTYYPSGELGFSSQDIPAFRSTNGTVYNLLHSGNYSSYALPLSAGSYYPITGRLYIRANAIEWDSSDGTSMYGMLDSGSDHVLSWYDTTGWKTVYHSGNANKNTVSWSASGLTLGNQTEAQNPYIIFDHIYNSTEYRYWIQGYQGLLLFGPAANARAMTIDSSSHIGINCTSPAYSLDVGGQSRFLHNGSGVFLGYGGNSIDALYTENNSFTAALHINRYSTGNVTLAVGGGDVCIGTISSTSGYKLTVNGSISAYGLYCPSGDLIISTSYNGAIYITPPTASTYINWGDKGIHINGYANSGTQASITTKNNAPLSIAGNGSIDQIYLRGDNACVGFNTSSPYSLVEIAGAHSAPDSTSIASSAMLAVNKHQDDGLFFGFYSGYGWIQSAYYGTSSTHSSDHCYKLILNPLGGNVGIGTTSPSYKLDVNGSLNATSIYLNGVQIEGTLTSTEIDTIIV